MPIKYIQPKKLPVRFPNIMEVSGNPYDVGYEIGSKMSGLIEKYVAKWFDYVSSIPGKSSPSSINRVQSFSKKECLSLTRKYLPFAEDYAPDLIEECKGMAEGAGVGFEELFHMNCRCDVVDALFRPEVKERYLQGVGCTSFAVSPSAAEDKNAVIIGETYDLSLPETHQEASILVKLVPKNGPSVTYYTCAGVVGAGPGLNSYGIGLSLNKLFPSDTRPGVPYSFIIRKALQQKTLNEFLNVIFNCHRASGYNFTVGSSNGVICGLEVTATKHEVLIPVDGIYGHTNHYISEQLKPFQTFLTGSSIIRFIRINELLIERKGKITLEDCMEWTKDHVDYPYSICTHGSENEPVESGGRSLTGFIILPKALKILATYGNPCTQPYVEYDLPKA